MCSVISFFKPCVTVYQSDLWIQIFILFDISFGQLWYPCKPWMPVWPKSGLSRPEILKKIRDIFRSDFSTFWLSEIWSENVAYFFYILGNLTHFGRAKVAIQFETELPIWLPSGSNCLSQNGKNPGLFRSDFRTFWLGEPNKLYWNLIWKSPRFFLFWDNLIHLGAKLTCMV